MKPNLSLFPALALCGFLSMSGCFDKGKEGLSVKKPLKNNVKIGLTHCCVKEDAFMNNILQAITDEAQKEPNVSLIAMRADDNPSRQEEQIKELLAQNVQALLISNASNDPHSPYNQRILDLASNAKVPIVFYNRGVDVKLFKSTLNTYYVGSIPAQSGLYQGELIVKNWKEHPEWDKNRDGIIQYVLLKGQQGHRDAEGRTKWVAATIENYPAQRVKAERLHIGVGDWDREKGKTLMTRWLNEDASKIEMVISNNDDMALGALDALKEKGEYLPIFGVDALPQALEKIKSGEITGTVLQNARGQGINALRIAINLAAKREPGIGLDEKIIERQVMIPYIGIDQDNLSEFLP